jgi:hypothetical protein
MMCDNFEKKESKNSHNYKLQILPSKRFKKIPHEKINQN